MSGSPVIQNGRLVGAVTHVLVGDAREGYGIYIDSMTEAFREFGAKKLNRNKKPSIRKALTAAKEKAKQLNQSRDKVKNIDRGRAL